MAWLYPEATSLWLINCALATVPSWLISAPRLLNNVRRVLPLETDPAKTNPAARPRRSWSTTAACLPSSVQSSSA